MTVLGMVAQMERRFIEKCQRNGIECAKANRVYQGRQGRRVTWLCGGHGGRPSSGPPARGRSETFRSVLAEMHAPTAEKTPKLLETCPKVAVDSSFGHFASVLANRNMCGFQPNESFGSSPLFHRRPAHRRGLQHRCTPQHACRPVPRVRSAGTAGSRRAA